MRKGPGVPSYTQKTKETTQPRKYNFRTRETQLSQDKEKALTKLEKARKLHQMQRPSMSMSTINTGYDDGDTSEDQFEEEDYENFNLQFGQGNDNESYNITYFNNNIPYENLNPNMLQDLNQLKLSDESESKMELEVSIEDQEFESKEPTKMPTVDNIPKQSLSIKNAKIKKYYDDQNSFETIQNDALTVVHKTMLVSSFIFNFADDIFMKVIRPTNYLQCNQSVFNYPITNTRKQFSVKQVEQNIKALNTQVLNYKTHVLGSLGKIKQQGNGQEISYNVPADVVHETLRFAARGASYMNKVYSKALKLLDTLVSDAGYNTYPSLEHHLYEGDYSDLFAFNVLRYLFRIDTDKNIEIKGIKDVSKGLKKGDSTVLYKTTNKKEREGKATVPAQRYIGQNSKNPTQMFEFNDMYTGKDDIKEDDLNSIFAGVSSNHSYAKKPSKRSVKRAIKKGKQYYDTVEVFLKPTRGTKLLLFSEPNVFMYNLNYAVAKGLSILMKIGVVPEKIITNLKICSLYTGAIYKLSATKNSLKISPDTSCKSYAIMKQPSWTQNTVILDLLPFKSQSSQIETVINLYSKQYPSALFNADKYKFSKEKYLPAVERNCMKLLITAWSGNVLNSYINQLDSIKKLACQTPLTFVKASTKIKLQNYNYIADAFEYPEKRIEGEIKTNGFQFMADPPRLPKFKFGQFGLSDDININYYKEGVNYTNKTLVKSAEEYIAAAETDLVEYPILQIPLLHRGDTLRRTKNYLGAEDLDSSNGTLEDISYEYNDSSVPFPKEILARNFQNKVKDIATSTKGNIGTYIISTFVEYWRNYYMKNPFNTNIYSYLSGLVQDEVTRVVRANEALQKVLKNIDGPYQDHEVDYKTALGSIFRFIFCDSKLNNYNTKPVTNEELTYFFDELAHELNIYNNIIDSQPDNVFGELIKFLVERVKNIPSRRLVKLKQKPISNYPPQQEIPVANDEVDTDGLKTLKVQLEMEKQKLKEEMREKVESSEVDLKGDKKVEERLKEIDKQLKEIDELLN